MRGKIRGKDVHVEAELRCAIEEAKDVFLFPFSAWDDGIEDNVQKSHALQHIAIDSCITNFLPTSFHRFSCCFLDRFFTDFLLSCSFVATLLPPSPNSTQSTAPFCLPFSNISMMIFVLMLV